MKNQNILVIIRIAIKLYKYIYLELTKVRKNMMAGKKKEEKQYIYTFDVVSR